MFIWHRWWRIGMRLELLEQRVADLEAKLRISRGGTFNIPDEKQPITVVDASHIQGLGPHPFIITFMGDSSHD